MRTLQAVPPSYALTSSPLNCQSIMQIIPRMQSFRLLTTLKAIWTKLFRPTEPPTYSGTQMSGPHAAT